jgi:GNAT superfamily N-acetyltransferase
MELPITISEVTIREHLPEIDVLMAGLHQSERELFDKTAPWPEIRANYLEHLIEMQEAYEGTCLIAYTEGKAIGFIFGYVEEQDNSRIEVYTGRELYISDGYVQPAYRRKGVYTRLNAAIEKKYVDAGVKRITRFTLVNNEPMKQFMADQGYQVTRVLFEKWL